MNSTQFFPTVPLSFFLHLKELRLYNYSFPEKFKPCLPYFSLADVSAASVLIHIKFLSNFNTLKPRERPDFHTQSRCLF